MWHYKPDKKDFEHTWLLNEMLIGCGYPNVHVPKETPITQEGLTNAFRNGVQSASAQGQYESALAQQQCGNLYQGLWSQRRPYAY